MDITSDLLLLCASILVLLCNNIVFASIFYSKCKFDICFTDMEKDVSEYQYLCIINSTILFK